MLNKVHISTTWRLRLNRPYAAAMRPFCEITFTSCYCYYYSKRTTFSDTDTKTLPQHYYVFRVACILHIAERQLSIGSTLQKGRTVQECIHLLAKGNQYRDSSNVY